MRRAADSAGAIYIDFECLKKPATPVLLGILKDLRGEERFKQLVLDEALTRIPVRPGRLRHVTIQEAAAWLVAEADANDCPIVGWSFFDLNVLLTCGIAASLRKRIRNRYVNALEIARPWKTEVYPEVKIARAGKFAPKNTLDKFAALAGYPHVAALLGGAPAKWIKDIQKALSRTGRYRSVKKTAKDKWRALLDYNEHDCRALRSVLVKASVELEKWRAYRSTKYCFLPDRGRRICFKVGSVDTNRDAVLDRFGASKWAFITAWNPQSEQLPPAENSRRQSQLVSAVQAAGYQFLPGEGIGTDSSWPP